MPRKMCDGCLYVKSKLGIREEQAEIDGQVWDPIHIDSAFLERCTSGYSLVVRAGCLPTRKERNSALLFFHLQYRWRRNKRMHTLKGDVIATVGDQAKPKVDLCWKHKLNRTGNASQSQRTRQSIRRARCIVSNIPGERLSQLAKIRQWHHGIL